jgi:hypothetical protein
LRDVSAVVVRSPLNVPEIIFVVTLY